MAALAGAVLTLTSINIAMFFDPFGRRISFSPHRKLLRASADFALVTLLDVLVPARRPLLPTLVLLVALVGSLMWGGVGSSCSIHLS
jgi:hypothetical protein